MPAKTEKERLVHILKFNNLLEKGKCWQILLEGVKKESSFCLRKLIKKNLQSGPETLRIMFF